MFSNNLSAISTFLESPEGKKSLENFALKIKTQIQHEDRWIEKFRKKFGKDPDVIINTLLEKYYSDDYIEKEHSRGFQPRESLLWIVWAYAKRYCQECTESEYLNSFTGEAYYIGSYIIQIMYGQGAILKIDRIKN